MPYQNQLWIANPIMLGAFTLPNSVVRRMEWYQTYNEVFIQDIPDPNLRSQAKPWRRSNNNNGIFLGEDPSWPRIGDERIWYDIVPQQLISICAVQTADNSFEPYVAEAGKKEILLLEPGNHTITELYQHAHAAATNWAFVMRAIGFVILWVGLRFLLEPLTFVAEHVPLLGPCLGRMVGLLAAVVTGLVAMVLCGTIIVCAWIGYRIAALDFLVWVIPLGLVLGGLVGFLYLQFQGTTADPSSVVAERILRRRTDSTNNNNNLPSAKAVPYETIPEAHATILVDEPAHSGSFQSEYPVTSTSMPSAPPAYMDVKTYPKADP